MNALQKPRRGRPLRGAVPRVKVSITLNSELAMALTLGATADGATISAFTESVLLRNRGIKRMLQTTDPSLINFQAD